MIPTHKINKEVPILAVVSGKVKRFIISDIKDGMVVIRPTGPKNCKLQWRVPIDFVREKCDLARVESTLGAKSRFQTKRW